VGVSWHNYHTRDKPYKWIRIRVRFFQSFWLRVRIRVRKKNAESFRSRLRNSGSGPTSCWRPEM